MPVIALAVVVVACAGTACWFAWDLHRAGARIASRRQTVETSFGALEYATLGDGPAVLLVHGAGGGFDQGLDVAAAAADGGLKLIVPSRFGYLGSSMPAEASPGAQADAFVELLDHLGLEQVSLLAVSAGALVGPRLCGALCRSLPRAGAAGAGASLATGSGQPGRPLGAGDV